MRMNLPRHFYAPTTLKPVCGKPPRHESFPARVRRKIGQFFRHIKIRVSVRAGLLLLQCIAAAALLAGCREPETAAYRTIGTVIVTVDSAMNAYRDACRSGLIASNLQEQVHAAYDTYHQALLMESNAVVTLKSTGNTKPIYQAAALVTATSAQVIGLVQQFLPADRLLKLKGQ